MATPAGRRVKGSALAASLILIAACGGSGSQGRYHIAPGECSPWSAPDGQNGYQHCAVTTESGTKYDCYKRPGDFSASCDQK